MSEDQKRDEEAEVEGHRLAANDEPSDEAQGEDDVEAHSRLATPRLDSPRES